MFLYIGGANGLRILVRSSCAKKRKPCVKIKTSDELGFIETNRWRRFKFLPKANLTGARKRKPCVKIKTSDEP